MNGRLDIMKNNTNSYLNYIDDNSVSGYQEALTGEHSTTLLSKAFFSKENIQIIHNGIRAGIYIISNKKYIIGNQNINVIKIIMRHMFLQNVKYLKNITEEISILNKLVIQFCIHNAYNEIQSYIKFKKDVSELAVPIQKPSSTNSKGENVLELKPWF